MLPVAMPEASTPAERLLRCICIIRTPIRSTDTGTVDASRREEIVRRYRIRSREFAAIAARRTTDRAPAKSPLVPGACPPESSLTEREIQVLELVSEGLVNREIGERLFLAEETVKSHLRHLLVKLEARSRAHAVAIGFRRKIIA